MIYGGFILLFTCEIILNRICFRAMNIFVLFLWILFGESAKVSPTTGNIDKKTFLFSASSGFSGKFF